ncbi:amidase family protein [Mycoplasmopsis ciconiae]|uniref:Amidase family protein n=1 Tax=Mycoplasmopsis ciconiae TaxID=561067 RepID=A0ABU7MLN3_9BACT|nr:amidase family protein [Mycoplasmopsis ciconiae]
MDKILNLGNVTEAIKELKNDQNNCVAYIYENPKQESEGLLSGAVVTIKDVFATKDAPTQASSKFLQNFKPSYDATVVERLTKQGAIKVAKVHNDELALGGTGTFSGFGLIKNPLDASRLAGGSSSGSVATFTKSISIALGSDTGDSVRLPASYNGVVGFKPSYGAIPRYGMFAYASSLDTVAYFAHNVNDIAVFSKAVFGKDIKDMTSVDVKIDNVQNIKPKKVIAFNVFDYLEPYVAQSYQNLIDKLKADNVEVELIDLNLDLIRSIKPIYDIVSYSEASSNLSNLNSIAFGQRENGENWSEIMTNSRSKYLGKNVQRRLILGSYYLYQSNQETMLLKAHKVRRVYKEYMDNISRSADLVIYPASAAVAAKIDSSLNKSYDFMDYILTGSNLIGTPSLTMKMGVNDQNLPFNIALDSYIYNDEKLLSHALYIEKLLEVK